jgi:asparagine synthase (glutamine-hydrolysing)
MCGIAGFWTSDSRASGTAAEATARRMADAIRHRGPDSDGLWFDPEAGLALAHRRLSILDVSPAGAQPMSSHSGRYVIVFNGEIYNHLDLRTELEAASDGIAWRGHSDTETLLAAFDIWGIERTLQRSIGMFAYAVWDIKERTLVLARDRMGEKPLYYGWSGSTFLFGSELKALRAFPGFVNALNRDAVTAYLRYSYVPAPHSIYDGIYKLPPASYILFASADRSSASEPIAYWSFKDIAEKGVSDPFGGSYQERSAALEQVLQTVTASQMLSDVPLGAFLSGGVDSSLITALMQSQSGQAVRTFSIGFELARFNEAELAREVARHLKTQHTEFIVTESDALAVVPDLPGIFDEPFADSSQIPTILLSRLTRQSVTVAMSGDGGDEMFGGYNRYLFGPDLWQRTGQLPKPVRKALGVGAKGMQRMFTAGSASGAQRLAARAGLPVTAIDRLSKFGGAVANADSFDELYRELVSTWPQPSSIALHTGRASSLLDEESYVPSLEGKAERMMALDALSYLPDDIMVKVDRSAMSASLETRAPFLDQRVVEFAWRLPLADKIEGRIGKRILRDMLYTKVPKALIERPKQGFAIPVDTWLRGGLKDWAASLLSPQALQRSGVLNADSVTRVWQDHCSGRENAGTKLWTVLMLQAWLETHQTTAVNC